jgi:hypothetical protein
MARDYILRMVEQIAAMLATIMAKRQAGQTAEAQTELDGNSLRTIGMSLEDLKKLSPETLANLLANSGPLGPVRAITLAELLLVDADIREEKGDTAGSVPNIVHAFCLIADSIETLTSDDQIVYRQKLNLLAKKLDHLRSHPYIGERMRNLTP